MYQIGDLIIYGSYGVCKVEAIGKTSFSELNNDKEYYTLYPLYQNGKIFTPVDTNVFMRPIISRKEAEKLISLIPSISENKYDSSNARLLGDQYQEAIQTYDCVNWVKVIKTAYAKNQATVSEGKKPGKVDESYMKKAEDLLYGELAVALGIPKNEIKDYIEDQANKLILK